MVGQEAGAAEGRGEPAHGLLVGQYHVAAGRLADILLEVGDQGHEPDAVEGGGLPEQPSLLIGAFQLGLAELATEGKIAGISDVRDDSSSRTGMRLVIELKRDAVAKVVLNNLYKHTALQDNFSCNMIALVDGVPRTLTLDGFVRHWISHQIEVIQRRTRYRLRKAEEQIGRAHV